MLDDPSAATIYRVSGEPPFPDPAHPAVPPTILPRHVTLRDRQTVATVVPFASRDQVPESLLRYLSDQFNKEIEGGDTYPMMDPMPAERFSKYWFQNFAGVMLLGNIESAAHIEDGKDWSRECLGTFYIKPNYPGRSSHVCNAGFIVTDASRNRGVGRLMGETYLEWAPKLGYTYSVFNLVYETNVASCKIWDALGFKRIGRVKSAGNLKSYPNQLVDAIIYGRDLSDVVGGMGSEELKSRLRSAATHYKLLDGDVLMLKDKEVISDPQRQYDIAKTVHTQSHAGINKTTANIADRYHWSRIKETVSDLGGKPASFQARQSSPGATAASTSSATQAGAAASSTAGVKRPNLNSAASSYGASSNSKRSSPLSPPASAAASSSSLDVNPAAVSQFSRPPPLPPILPPLPSSVLPLPDPSPFNITSHNNHHHHQYTDMAAISILPSSSSHNPHHLQTPTDTTMGNDDLHNVMLSPLHPPHHHHSSQPPSQQYPITTTHSPMVLPPLAIDPAYQPIDPQIISQSHSNHSDLHSHHAHHHDYPFDHHHQHHVHNHNGHDPDADTFQALLNAADDDDDVGVGVTPTSGTHHHHHHPHHSQHDQRTREEEDAADQAAVDRDLEMLIEPQDDDDDDIPAGSGAMDVDITTGSGSAAKPSSSGSTSAGGGGGSSSGGGGSTGKMDVSHLLSEHVDDEFSWKEERP
ncbi:hypothetical protein B0H63DRAFT_494394 [Podospora didyma]|uniref:N-acetyltransferase domain-containing protein n=1 Tax=Podospora didyma TaxID=330526 RepID=A0AAE0TZM8_9PEZI|nr:hypothetical protein B0H63DRAFT_494394 [Podospora didyma]